MKRNIIKKTFLVCAALVVSAIPGAKAQGLWDAYRFSAQNPDGTARSVAMGNAFTALGGDMGSIWLNPAGSAVNNFNEASITPALTLANSSTVYAGTSTKDDRTNFNIANIGYLGSVNIDPVGVRSISFGLVFNRMKDFSSAQSARGHAVGSSWLQAVAMQCQGIDKSVLESDNAFYTDAPWNGVLAYKTFLIDPLPDSDCDYFAATENLDHLTREIYLASPVDQFYHSYQRGYHYEADLNCSMNIDNIVYLGANIGLQTLYYKQSNDYTEMPTDKLACESKLSAFTQSYSQRTIGSGVNLKVGVICTPIPELRFGASIQTPTWMWLTEDSEMGMSSSFSDGDAYHKWSPLQSFDYRLRSPFKWNVGAALTIAKMAVISVDYQMEDYSTMKLSDRNNNTSLFDYENALIKDYCTSRSVFRAGAEVTFPENISVRAGYQNYSTGVKKEYAGVEDNFSIGSLGIGWASPSGFFIDATYQRYLTKQEEVFSLYDMPEAPGGHTEWGRSKIYLTLGFRF